MSKFTSLPDIQDKDDVKILVNAFYNKVRNDDLLAVVFSAQIKDEDWPLHLERMYSFWNTVLFAQKEYRGNPFSKHAKLPIYNVHFERWLGLFNDTLDEHFKGLKVEEAKQRVIRMGKMFQTKLKQIRINDNYKSIM